MEKIDVHVNKDSFDICFDANEITITPKQALQLQHILDDLFTQETDKQITNYNLKGMYYWNIEEKKKITYSMG